MLVTQRATRSAGKADAFPRAVPLFVAALFGFAGLVAATYVATFGAGSVRLSTLALLFPLLVAGGSLLVRFQYREHVDALDLFEAALAPAIYLAPGLPAMLLFGTAQAISNLLHRNRPVKAAFNVAQALCAAGVGSLVFAAARSGTGFGARNVGALLAAMAAAGSLSHLTLAVVIGLTQRQRLRTVLAGLSPVILPGWVLGWAVNATFGLLFVSSIQWSQAAMLLWIPPLLALHFAYRAYATAATDRARLSGLHRATRALAGPVNPRDAIRPFLVEVRACFAADVVDLVIVEGASRTVHRLAQEYETRREEASDETLAATFLALGTAMRATPAHADPTLAALLRREGWRGCLGAPLLENGRTVGVLCAYNQTGLAGFEEGELGVLQALAQEVAGALQKGRLLEAVFDERRKLAEIVTHTSDGILTIDSDGTVLTWNPGFEHISGYAAASMIGQHGIGQLEPCDAEGRDVPLQAWATAAAAFPADVRIVTSTQQSRWLSCSYTRVDDVDGKPALLIAVARDITGARELEQLKDDFVATVSHELRTPLTPIKAWASTLLSLGDALNREQREEGLQSMLRQANRLEHLVTNLLQVSMVERGVGEHPGHPVDVNLAVGKVVEEFRAGYPGRTIRLSPVRGGCIAQGDEVWIEQILSNLLSNAIKYSPAPEPIDVSVAFAGDEIAVSVEDHGPGIPPQETERIFERFKRLGDHLTRAQGGAGLGLYIARQLALSIGGTLNVDTSRERGTCFTLRLRKTAKLAVLQ